MPSDKLAAVLDHVNNANELVHDVIENRGLGVISKEELDSIKKSLGSEAVSLRGRNANLRLVLALLEILEDHVIKSI